MYVDLYLDICYNRLNIIVLQASGWGEDVKINYKRLKSACYTANISMSVITNLSPLLFLTFRNLYGISYSLLGLLVLINFCTQLSVDLCFSFFSHKFNIPISVKITPLLATVGLSVYAISPFLFPNSVYIGLVIGTVIFSASGGLAEVLISPVIAEIPAKDPDREMSKLHSVYAWGVVFVVLFSTLFLFLLGEERWYWLPLTLSIVPLISFVLYLKVDIPVMKTAEKISVTKGMFRCGGVWLLVFAIFLGGAAECTMGQWCSSYIEGALGISKIWGDIFGVAVFSVALGFGRTLYSKIGKNIEKVLFFGAIGTTICYLIAALTSISYVGLAACAITGFFVSMLWPGTLIVASDRYKSSGVIIFALMAAGGDFGASVGPQLVGVVTDAVMKNSMAIEIAEKLSITIEQLGMKCGMLVGMIFSLAAIIVYAIILGGLSKKKAEE